MCCGVEVGVSFGLRAGREEVAGGAMIFGGGKSREMDEMDDVHFRSHGRAGRAALVVVALAHEVVEVIDDVFELL